MPAPVLTSPLPATPPLRQSRLDFQTAGPPLPLTLRDAARDDRWLGLGVRDVRWAPDGSAVYFRWHPNPAPGDDPDADPWFRVDRAGRTVQEVPDSAAHWIPAERVSWSRDGRTAAWVNDGRLYVYRAGAHGASWRAGVRIAFAGSRPARNATVLPDGTAVHFLLEEDLYRYDVAGGAVRRIAYKHVRRVAKKTDAAEWLERQQLELFEHLRRAAEREAAAAARDRRLEPIPAQAVPVAEGETLEDVQLSPDGRYVVFRLRRENPQRPPTRYVDFVTLTGYAQVREARSKVGEPRDEYRLGIVGVDPSVHPDSVAVTWARLPEAGERATVFHGPYWSLEGDRAVVQAITLDHRDLWIGELDLETGQVRVITHDHDGAWLGGPPVQANYTEPALLEWLPGGRFVFASERSGWSHLYLIEGDGRVRALTAGEWEVRGAQLSRDRTRWLITASREHPSDDHLYTMPAAGGELTRLTAKPGRHAGVLSPDGQRLAVVYSESVQLPDLFLRDPAPRAPEVRITVSGTDAYYRHRLVRPEIVSLPHPDGKPVWAALFKPERPNPERAAVLHIHGGGYRQFSHRGWSVYGWANHLGLINYLVQQGYTVLDFDYRGSAGFGRDYRTDIHRAMGMKDVDGAVAAVDYLAREHGVDRSRVGLYGISYGGFFTLMALFRYPGVFAAGIANAAVTDWAHYSDRWTSRILDVPHEDPEAYRVSSPIYYADRLEDPLLIVHGLIDDNVHFQDAARLIQRLIEAEKTFEVMVYPVERHTIASETSRYDYVRRAAEFFDRHLRGPGARAGAQR